MATKLIGTFTILTSILGSFAVSTISTSVADLFGYLSVPISTPTILTSILAGASCVPSNCAR